MQVQLANVVDWAPMSRAATLYSRLTRLLRDKREETDRKQGEIGAALIPPMSQGTVSLYEREPYRIRDRGPLFANAFFRAYGFSDDEVRALTVELFSDLATLLTSGTHHDLQVVSGGEYINVYAAGTGPAWGDVDVLEVIFLPGLERRGGAEYIGLMATGESMAPYLSKGDIAVILRDDGAVEDGDYCGVWLANDGCVIKRLVRELPTGVLLLESLNPRPGEERYFEAPLGSRVLGKVVRRVTHG